MNCASKSQKIHKLSNLRQVSPNKALQIQIFSQNLIKQPKIKAIPVVHQTSKSITKKTQEKEVNPLLFTERLNRKLTEKNRLQDADNETKVSAQITPSQNLTNTNYQSKSMTSTKANSQKLSISNSSIDECFDENTIILNGHQNLDKIIIPNQNQIKFSDLINANLNQLKSVAQAKKKQLSITDFEILSFCGQGSFGAVYIVKHRQTGTVYALKKIMKQKITTQIDRQCLIKEMKIHLKLNHPNIIKFYTTFSSAEAVYFLMELCCSGNAYQKLKKQGSFSETRVKSIIRQVCSAIDYLHSLNVIHRDIKAENIVLHGSVVKLCDFGWATEGQYSHKSLCGTPIYLSPEIVKNQCYDKKVDVWSIGVLTYELIYGRIPFDIKCQDDLHKIVDDQIYFPQDKEVSQSCKDFMKKCLEKDSFKRWDTFRLLTHSFLKRQ